LEHAVDDGTASGRRLVLEGCSPLQKKIRFKRLVRSFEAIITVATSIHRSGSRSMDALLRNW
jgi:hypothetical protein